MICFDWFYPEAARTLALQGADIIAHPSNLVLPHCPDSMVTRCLENRVFSVTANRIGSEARGGKDRLTFIGMSEVVSPRGHILHRASREAEDLTIVEIDPTEARTKAINSYNDLLRDRRPALYGGDLISTRKPFRLTLRRPHAHGRMDHDDSSWKRHSSGCRARVKGSEFPPGGGAPV